MLPTNSSLPFMDTKQNFSSLMTKVTSLDVSGGLTQLETVNSNITLIRLWFSRAEGMNSEAQMRYPATQGIPQNPEYMKSMWRLGRDEIEVIEGKPLGVGGWGEVRVAMFRGVRVAAKFLHEAIISPHNIDLFLREMDIAARVRHPNLLLFIGASLDDNKPVILTELMPANLRDIIEAPRKAFPQGHVTSVATDVACGLNYLHLMRPDPIIPSRLMTMGPGNASYAAPESSNPRLQSAKMDVYSYGILLLEMATRKFPDYDQRATQLEALPWQEIAKIIKRCISEDPTNRPTMKDILTLLPQLNK
ncbi:hypothetical protein EMCRGX_G031078 [Ephydatia muelleri]